MSINPLFDKLLERGGSDLHLSPGYPPMLRIRGSLTPDGDRALSSAEIEQLLMPLLTEHQRTQFQTTGDLDFAHAHGSKARFRANYLKKLTGVSGAIEKKLNDLGVFHYWQIAELDHDTAHKIGEEVGLPARADGWVAQSKALTAEAE